jgi:oligopeptide transport system substrate-binding protein
MRAFTSRFVDRLTLCVIVSAVLLTGCSQIERPAVEPFYAESTPPPKQELRWSNGKMPKTLDPARSIAAPESDIVRALYEGLTDLDSSTLKEVPGVAEEWRSSDDFKTWTFTLRKDARWSNGELVTADDFVRSWKRLSEIGEKTGNAFLYQNIVGLHAPKPSDTPAQEPSDFIPPPDLDFSRNGGLRLDNIRLAEPGAVTTDNTDAVPSAGDKSTKLKETAKAGVEAVDESTLRVRLELPDKDFPRLVSNPVFRPVYDNGAGLDKSELDASIVTNGPFKIASITDSEVTLDRSDNYWNRDQVSLERVRFITSQSSEDALNAYRNGEVDIVTNAAIEPVALKILAPYEDFRRTAHSALNYYEFNTAKAPFSDRRIREALAIAIDREKLTEGELEGATKPANAFLPLGNIHVDELSFDVERALSLFAQAGYPNGENFPRIRLVVNRNDTQQRVAKSVARMWAQHLNLETEIIVKEWADIELTKAAGEYDLIRRGVVLPAPDELVSLTAIFGFPDLKHADPGSGQPTVETPVVEKPSNTDAIVGESTDPKDGNAEKPSVTASMAEEDAMYEMNAIPLYFPMSYSLVKPYVKGFEMNALDAPSLHEMSIDASWQPTTRRN